MAGQGLVIEFIEQGSIADEVGLEVGDKIIQINQQNIADILDYQFLTAEEVLEILVQKANPREQWILEIEKDFNESLGISFKQDGLGRTRQCGNQCVFCFVDQMPPQMRNTLYIKDDDYRLSFAQGNFITLTNVGRQELKRIVDLRLSPLYLSVHTTNPVLRQKMMGNAKAGQIMSQLNTLAQAGLQIHTQVVLCPGINDGAELERTISDLGQLWPAVSSLAVVPVGLTKYRQGLYPLRRFTKDEATAVIKQIHDWQTIFKRKYRHPLVFASDEFYLLAQLPLPSVNEYYGFPQLENGVGLVRQFLDQWQLAARQLPVATSKPYQISIVTGALAADLWVPILKALNNIQGLQANLYVLENTTFGNTVTVAGLLTGQDVIFGLTGQPLGDKVYLPTVMLRDDEIFLDDITLKQLVEQLRKPFIPVSDPLALVQDLLTSIT